MGKLYLFILVVSIFFACATEESDDANSNVNIDDGSTYEKSDVVKHEEVEDIKESVDENGHSVIIDDDPVVEEPDNYTPEQPDNNVDEPNTDNMCHSDGENGYKYYCYQQGGGPGFFDGGCEGCTDCNYLEARGGDNGYVKALCYTSQIMENFQPTSFYFIACIIKELDDGGCDVFFNMNGKRLNTKDTQYIHDDEISDEFGTRKSCLQESSVYIEFECTD